MREAVGMGDQVNRVEGAIAEEIAVLDKLSSAIRAKLTESASSTDGLHAAAEKELIRIGDEVRKGFDELGDVLYGKTVKGVSEDEDGNDRKPFCFRITQANVGYLDEGCMVLARNSRLASELVSANVEDQREVSNREGERYYVVGETRTFDGPIGPNRSDHPDFQSMIVDAGHGRITTVRRLRSGLQNITIKDMPPPVEAVEEGLLPEAIREDRPNPTTNVVLWPENWDDVTLHDASSPSSLSASFFTRTSPDQEKALANPRGITFVEGVAGAGKTSVALGRLKFLSNFAMERNLGDFGLKDADRMTFHPARMMGFVLGNSLKAFLKQTTADLHLHMLPIKDLREFRKDTIVLYGIQEAFKTLPTPAAEMRTRIGWLSALDVVVARSIAKSLQDVLKRTADVSEGVRSAVGRIIDDLLSDSTQWKLPRLAARIKADTAIAEARDRQIALSSMTRATQSEYERAQRREDMASERAGPSALSRKLLSKLSVRDHLKAATLSIAFTEAVTDALSLPSNDPEAVAQIEELRALLKAVDEDGVARLTEDDKDAIAVLMGFVARDFERDGLMDAELHFLHDISRHSAVFIDEVQDFTEIQVALMGMTVDDTYGNLTLSGDFNQRLNRGGSTGISHLFPLSKTPPRIVSLSRNFRQRDALAEAAASYRAIVQGGVARAERPTIEVHAYGPDDAMAEFTYKRLKGVPQNATIAVICSDMEEAKHWHDVMFERLAAYHSPQVSTKGDLTSRAYLHFTDSVQAKGLEFDAVIVPDLGSFDLEDPIARNKFYVAISRPRHGLLIGMRDDDAARMRAARLIDAGLAKLLRTETDQLKRSLSPLNALSS